MTLFRSPTSGFVIERHPDAARLMKLLRKKDLAVYEVGPPEGRDCAEVWWEMIGIELFDDIERVWGKADGLIPGKYKRAHAYLFQFEGLTVVGVCERGDRGSSWFVEGQAPPGHHSLGTTPALWLDFVDTLWEACRGRLSDEEADEAFDKDSGPMVRRRALAERHLLDATLVPTSTVRRATRL